MTKDCPSKKVKGKAKVKKKATSNLLLQVTKSIPGLGRVKVGFKPGPLPEIGVQHPSLATMNEQCGEAKCLCS